MKEYSAEAKAFYKSKAWQRTRKAYIAQRDGICERCIKRGEYRPGEIVHHKIHLNDANLKVQEIALAFENLELLCMDCHNKEHFKELPQKRYAFTEDGQLIIQEETE